jgi:hypothetical protein
MNNNRLKEIWRDKIKHLGAVRASEYFTLEEINANFLPIVESIIWQIMTDTFDEDELEDITARWEEMTEEMTE